MSYNFARPLHNKILAGSFVERILEIQSSEEIRQAVNKIVSSEMQLKQIDSRSTLTSDEYRDYGFQDDKSRKELRMRIFKELVSNIRPANDDAIKLGFGGALPTTGEVQAKKQAFLITGLPASGKSTIATTIADKTGSIILDSDFAKRKFPEYNENFGASIVHEESTVVVFGDKLVENEPNMFAYCLLNDYNIVIPKIGYDSDSILSLAENLKKYGYDIHLTLVSLDRKKATQRAFRRFEETGRYVPLSLVFDVYGNDPILTYYRIKNHEILTSYGKISTDVNKGEKPIFIEGTQGNPVEYFE